MFETQNLNTLIYHGDTSLLLLSPQILFIETHHNIIYNNENKYFTRQNVKNSKNKILIGKQ